MDCKDILIKLRENKGLSQQELADKLFVTRQAVSRWERGEVLPSSDMLRRLSELFDVSINTLLGSPRQLICQSCGMPLEDGICGHDADGAVNEDYCKTSSSKSMAGTGNRSVSSCSYSCPVWDAGSRGDTAAGLHLGGRLTFCRSTIDRADGLWYDESTL